MDLFKIEIHVIWFYGEKKLKIFKKKSAKNMITLLQAEGQEDEFKQLI